MNRASKRAFAPASEGHGGTASPPPPPPAPVVIGTPPSCSGHGKYCVSVPVPSTSPHEVPVEPHPPLLMPRAAPATETATSAAIRRASWTRKIREVVMISAPVQSEESRLYHDARLRASAARA